MISKKTNPIKNILVITFGVIIIVSLSTCKKYPENDLWLICPESAIKSGYITAFTEDGVDIIPRWNTFLSNPPYGGFPAPTPTYNISTFFWRVHEDKKGFDSGFGTGSFHFFDNKKYIYIFFSMYEDINFQPATYNIFYERESNWKVLKLTKNGIFRIQRTYNNKIYEIQFN